MKLKVYEEQSCQKKLEVDIEKVKSELVDVQRADRMVRVDMEQLSKKVGVVYIINPVECQQTKSEKLTFYTPNNIKTIQMPRCNIYCQK